MPVEALSERVYRDLAKLGFKAESIAHLEVSRKCNEELATIKKIDTLRLKLIELKAKQAAKHERLGARHDKVRTRPPENLT